MRCDRLAFTGNAEALAVELRALVAAPESVTEAVAEIIAQVRASGDEALHEYRRRFDSGGTEPGPLRVPEAELEQAAERLDPAVRAALERAIENVSVVAQATAGRAEIRTVELAADTVELVTAPVERAAVYVPGGRAPYPSTVVMGVVPARVAGVQEIALCSPSGRDGQSDPAILAACRLAGAAVVYRMGGAHAVAALAYGTESVGAVDVIVGPGNLFVQEAKRQVFGQVGIDGFAGPSDLMVIADGTVADPAALGLDLVAQAEHGAGTLVVGISDSAELLQSLAAAVSQAPETGAVARLIQVGDLEDALDLAQVFAPEHLQLAGAGSEALAERATTAGCVFVGEAAGTAFGDYIAGSNHVLPTNGAARFASGLSTEHFQRSFYRVSVADPAELARVAAPLARAEGFELHARSMEARIRDNGSR